MSYVRNIYHIIINTKNSEMTIPEQYKKELYNYIWGIVKNKNSKLIRINGIPNHIHLLVEMHQSVALSDLVRDIKMFSTKWADTNEKFIMFKGWSKEYAAFSYSVDEIQTVAEYIINQENHHNQENYLSEYKRLIMKHGLVFYEANTETQK